MMKRNIYFILSLVMIMLLSFTVMAADNSLERIREKGKFVVGLDDTFAPMGFRDEEGNLVGFDIDLARVVAERMGVEVEFKPVDWDGVILSLKTFIERGLTAAGVGGVEVEFKPVDWDILSLKSGLIDVIWNGLTITEERAKQINFTEPYMNNRQVIVVRMNSDIQTKQDLAGKVVGLQMGSSSVNALYSDPDLVKSLKDIRQYATNAEALMDLQIGRLDAVVVDEMHGRYYYISKKPDLYRVLDEELGWEQYGVGVRKEDESFLAELNRILDELKADGTAEAISIKWFGENVIN